MTGDSAAIQQAVADGIRDGMTQMSGELSRAVGDAVREAMGVDGSQSESPAEQRTREIRDVLDRFEILIEGIAANVAQIQQIQQIQQEGAD